MNEYFLGAALVAAVSRTPEIQKYRPGAGHGGAALMVPVRQLPGPSRRAFPNTGGNGTTALRQPTLGSVQEQLSMSTIISPLIPFFFFPSPSSFEYTRGCLRPGVQQL